MFKMLDEPTLEQMKATRTELKKLLKENEHKKILVVYVFAGHGIVEAGTQAVVLNEFRKSTGFYWYFKVENMLRDIAEKYQNSFHLAFYACCREIHDPNRHCGGYTGTDEEVAKQAALEKKGV